MEQMKSAFDYLFSPLDKSHCDYFLYVTIISFVLFVAQVGNIVFNMKDKSIRKMIVPFLLSALSALVPYYQSRLFYSMCVN